MNQREPDETTGNIEALLPPGSEPIIVVVREAAGDIGCAVNVRPIVEAAPDPEVWGGIIADTVWTVAGALEGHVHLVCDNPECPVHVLTRDELFERIKTVLSKELEMRALRRDEKKP